MPISPLRSIPPAAAFVLLACTAGDDDTAMTRSTLPDGTPVIHYASLDHVPEDTVRPDVRIGSADGDPALTFADIRGVEAGPDGTLYVLDYQASEIRTFSPDGEHLATVTQRGQGPAELMRANGMVFGPDGTLWVQDHGQRSILGLDPAGGERARMPMIVSGYGFLWDVTVDSAGAFRQPWSHSAERPNTSPETGLQQGVIHHFHKSYDPATEAYDSIYLGPAEVQSYVVTTANGYSVMSVPFAPARLSAADRSGRIWTGTSDGYRLTRMDASADTSLVLEVAAEGPPITGSEREEWLTRMDNFGPDADRLKAELGGMFPERKPVLEQLATDDDNRLWVRRAVGEGELPRYDVFSADGEIEATVRFPGDMWPWLPPRIRDGRVYFVATDSLGVPYVVGAPVPGG